MNDEVLSRAARLYSILEPTPPSMNGLREALAPFVARIERMAMEMKAMKELGCCVTGDPRCANAIRLRDQAMKEQARADALEAKYAGIEEALALDISPPGTKLVDVLRAALARGLNAERQLADERDEVALKQAALNWLSREMAELRAENELLKNKGLRAELESVKAERDDYMIRLCDCNGNTVEDYRAKLSAVMRELDRSEHELEKAMEDLRECREALERRVRPCRALKPVARPSQVTRDLTREALETLIKSGYSMSLHDACVDAAKVLGVSLPHCRNGG